MNNPATIRRTMQISGTALFLLSGLVLITHPEHTIAFVPFALGKWLLLPSLVWEYVAYRYRKGMKRPDGTLWKPQQRAQAQKADVPTVRSTAKPIAQAPTQDEAALSTDQALTA